MANHVIRGAVRMSPGLVSRTLYTSSAKHSQLTAEQRDNYYPKLGNRDVVCYGWNGLPTYIDREEFPMPPVRFKENTPDVLALREKEKGVWKSLSIDEKKALYRASFCQTFAEMKAPTGEWKNVVSIILFSVVLTGWLMIWIKKTVYLELPGTITEEWKEKQTEQMIRQGQGIISGLSSRWDYDNNKWK